jgi:hypothetical protein
MQKIVVNVVGTCFIMLVFVAIVYVCKVLTVPLDSDPVANRKMQTGLNALAVRLSSCAVDIATWARAN